MRTSAYRFQHSARRAAAARAVKLAPGNAAILDTDAAAGWLRVEANLVEVPCHGMLGLGGERTLAHLKSSFCA